MSRLKGWSRMCCHAMTCERSASKNRKAFGSLTGRFNDNPVGGAAVGRFSGKTNVSCENTDIIKVTSPSPRVRVQRFMYLQDEAVKDCSSKNSLFYLILCFDKSSLNFKSQTETTQLHIRWVIVLMASEVGLESKAVDSQAPRLKLLFQDVIQKKRNSFFFFYLSTG